MLIYLFLGRKPYFIIILFIVNMYYTFIGQRRIIRFLCNQKCDNVFEVSEC
jgi:sorbitol-specific phosphotransferase system component IIC